MNPRLVGVRNTRDSKNSVNILFSYARSTYRMFEEQGHTFIGKGKGVDGRIAYVFLKRGCRLNDNFIKM